MTVSGDGFKPSLEGEASLVTDQVSEGSLDGGPDDLTADVPGVLGEQAWRSISSDPVLSRPPTPGSPGNVPAGDDLRLDIGWDRFEQLLVSVAHDVPGLNTVRFRRYGVGGQAQHGIDLAGRGPNRQYTVVQCKEHDTFSPADLSAAVKKFRGIHLTGVLYGA
jgi:hypothetical protein